MDYSDRSTSAPKRSAKSAPVGVGAPPGGSPNAGTPAVGEDLFNRQLLAAMLQFRDGNFDVRLPSDITGLPGKIADVFNEIVAISDRRSRDVARVSRMVGKEGKLKERMSIATMLGTRADEIVALNTLIDDLVWPTVEVTRA